MIPRGKGDGRGPRPDQLAAFVDGELSPEDRAEVESWLAEHPEAAAEVDDLRALTRLWQSAAPPEPAETTWARVLESIEAALSAAAVRPAPWRRLKWGLAGLSAAAATLILAMVLHHSEPVPPPAEMELLPLVTADDVEIISIDSAGVRALVVGAPPVAGSLDLLAAGEVSEVAVRSEMEGMDPFYSGDDSTAPIIVMMPREENDE
jgi:anti-sigma factor RsiW